MKTLYFATSNDNKVREMQKFFDQRGLHYKIEPIKADFVEPQILEVDTISRMKADEICRKTNKPVITEDSGLYIQALKGFPGAYTKQVHDMIGFEGILRLLQGKDRKANFESAIAYAEPGEPTKVFLGVIEGTIAQEPKYGHKDAWGHDPIFIPNGSTKTWAENMDSKDKDSHRTRALDQLVEYLKEQKD